MLFNDFFNLVRDRTNAMEVLISIFRHWTSSLSLPSILRVIPRRRHAPLANIGTLHLDGLCELYKVMSISDCENLTLALYTKGKDGTVNRPTLALEAYKERKNPVRYLRPHFTNPKGLLDAMAESNAYISGSRAADYFVPGSAEPHSDFDIYVQADVESIFRMLSEMKLSHGVQWTTPMWSLVRKLSFRNFKIDVRVLQHISKSKEFNTLMEKYPQEKVNSMEYDDDLDVPASYTFNGTAFLFDQDMPGQNNYWDRDADEIDLPDPVHEATEDEEHDACIQLRQFFADLYHYWDDYDLRGLHKTIWVSRDRGGIWHPGRSPTFPFEHEDDDDRLDEYDRGSGTLEVIEGKSAKSGVRVQLIFNTAVPQSTPFHNILRFHSSQVQCFISGLGAVHLYPIPSQRKEAYAWLRGVETPRVQAAREKYKGRGYRYVENHTSPELRRIGDNKSLFIPFPRREGWSAKTLKQFRDDLQVMAWWQKETRLDPLPGLHQMLLDNRQGIDIKATQWNTRNSGYICDSEYLLQQFYANCINEYGILPELDIGDSQIQARYYKE